MKTTSILLATVFLAVAQVTEAYASSKPQARPASASTPKKTTPAKTAVRPAQAPKKASAAQRPTAAAKPQKAAVAGRAAAGAAAGAGAAAAVAAPPAPIFDSQGNPLLHSGAYIVQDLMNGEVLLSHRATTAMPIASITKLMTAIIVLEAGQALNEPLSISEADVDRLKGTSSRLSIGTTLSREEMLHLALMSSENRAASALGRHYPGGLPAFISAMNAKARLLGLFDTRFADATGLDPGNISSPRDLARLVAYSSHFPLVRRFSTADDHFVMASNGRRLQYRNTNALIRSDEWSIGVSKTGFIREAGRCLVLQAWMNDRPIVIVLLDADNRSARINDAERIKNWVENAASARSSTTGARSG